MVLDTYIILALLGAALSMIAVPDFRDKAGSFLSGIAIGTGLALVMEASPFAQWLRYGAVFVSSICALPLLTYLHEPEEFLEAMQYFRAGLFGGGRV